ncbi:hypothetical protein M569_05139, partial [Genlisea aurea]
VRLRGRNVGASMVIDGSPDSNGSCSINIYISNNVQGINNSSLMGSSEVTMSGNLGVELHLEDLAMDRG